MEQPLKTHPELRAEVRARRDRFRRYSQKDLLRLAREPMVVYVLERAGSRFVISVALQRLALGRVGLLVLGLSAGENEAEFVYTEGFVASPRTYRPLSEMPRIQAALYKTAYHHANVRFRAL